MWSSFALCLFVTGTYFYTCTHFKRRNLLDPHCTLLQIPCAGSTGARIIYIEVDQALHFEMSLLRNTYN